MGSQRVKSGISDAGLMQYCHWEQKTRDTTVLTILVNSVVSLVLPFLFPDRGDQSAPDGPAQEAVSDSSMP